MCYQKLCVGSVCPPLKANKQAKLVERKVCLFQMSETGGERVTDDSPKADSPHTGNQWGKMFYREKWRGATTCRNSTVISDSHFQTGHQWSDQHHLGCFRYSYSSVPGAICSHLFAPSSRNWAQSDHHVANFSTWCFSICKTDSL